MFFLIIIYGIDENQLNIVKNDILNSYQVEIEIFSLDVVNGNLVNETVNTIYNQFKRIDVLFNNAGISIFGDSEMPLGEFEKMMNINLYGAYHFIHSVTPIMKKQKSGYIINLGSRSATITRGQLMGYAASKFALRGMSESCYRDLIQYGIKTTCINPGFVNTDMSTINIPNEQKVQVNDIAEAVEFLLKLTPHACIKEFVIESSHQTKESLIN